MDKTLWRSLSVNASGEVVFFTTEGLLFFLFTYNNWRAGCRAHHMRSTHLFLLIDLLLRSSALLVQRRIFHRYAKYR